MFSFCQHEAELAPSNQIYKMVKCRGSSRADDDINQLMNGCTVLCAELG